MDDHTIRATNDLTALVGSRLCHDLVNPLGAIGNGVELLAMMPGSSGPEVSLIEDAVRDAQARIRFFRVAFGQASVDSRVSQRDIHEIVDGLYGHGGRLSVTWGPSGDMPRSDAKIALLMLSCAEHALPLGGDITVTETAGTFRLDAVSKRVNADPDLWSMLRTGVAVRNLAPSEVQFMLMAQEALRQDRVVRADIAETSLMLTA
ncbi:MAG: histidine phosphotransferase family protein [Pseudomonadota bacterium]